MNFLLHPIQSSSILITGDRARIRMATIMKFNIPKSGRINIWNVQMMVVLTQNRLKKARSGRSKKPTSMTDEQWKEFPEKALSATRVCLLSNVLREQLDNTTMANH